MNSFTAKNGQNGWVQQTTASLRSVLATMAVCAGLYPLVIWGLGQILTPQSAGGSLVRNGQGQIVGSALIAQAFTRPEYFWPRSSAVDYNAAAAGGSNLSPTNPELRTRAVVLVKHYGATAGAPLPADLVTASGSGLDPHITLAAARYQAARVAAARGMPLAEVEALLAKHSFRPGGALTAKPLVNVLIVNMALDGWTP
ncbi:MAG: potassium-transporting ATPase subunit KdpC [Desulfobacteraceae bacterium]|nr:potassium-transporting ATPase subunit KdpC [Desulfobacteraceae bacterium]